MARAALSTGFAPLASSGARVLILGTLPGPRSLERHEYYAHPQNAFWPIMEGLFGPFGMDYSRRAAGLMRVGIAVWDVLAAAPRDGALDSRIERARAIPNDFTAFYRMHPGIVALCFNGTGAAQLYRRLVAPGLAPEHLAMPGHLLPSTSPTRTISREIKQKAWGQVLLQLVG